jgi:hypothetical protein
MIQNKETSITTTDFSEIDVSSLKDVGRLDCVLNKNIKGLFDDERWSNVINWGKAGHSVIGHALRVYIKHFKMRPISILAKWYKNNSNKETPDSIFITESKSENSINVVEKDSVLSYFEENEENNEEASLISNISCIENEKQIDSVSNDLKEQFIKALELYSKLIFDNSNIKRIAIIPITMIYESKKILSACIIVSCVGECCNDFDIKSIESIYYRFMNNANRQFTKALNEQLENEHVKSAIAQVMARNLSHNIGSHVFSNLIGKDIYTNLSDRINGKYYSISNNGEVSTEPDAQLAYFNQYLKSRMDYLSEVTFGISNILTTKKIYNDVFIEFDRVRLLLNHISGISDFEFEFAFIYTNRLNETQIINSTNPILVALPSDVLGCQAFYNIIENIIRNTAKHGENNEKKITFTIHIKDINILSHSKETLPNEIQQYYAVEIDDGIKLPNLIINDLVEKQNNRLNESVLDKDTKKLRNHSLGLLEMEASAAFLRQIELHEIESEVYQISLDESFYNDDKKLNIIKAFKTKENALGYRFFIRKPQEFLFIGDWESVDSQKKENLLNQGIWFKTETELKDDLKKGVAFAHRFIVCLKNEEEYFADNKLSDTKYECKALLPNKWVYVNDANTITNLLNENEFDTLKLEEKIWEILNQQDKFNISSCSILVDCPKSLSDYQIILLNHPEDIEQIKNYNGLPSPDSSTKAWIELLSSNALNKLPYYFGSPRLAGYKSKIKNSNFGKKEISTIVKNLLWDCYNHSVLVIDERIQEYSNLPRTDAPAISNGTVFQKSGVFITESPLSTNNLDDNLRKNIEQDIEKYAPTFLLIHYGILERHFKNDTIEINRCLKNWVEEKKVKVIVTSGRGKHSLKLPEYVRYLNLSSVLYAFVENQNKYSINYILNQARR